MSNRVPSPSEIKILRSWERVDEARKSLQFAVKQAVPLFIIAWPSDIIYVPDKKWTMLGLRAFMIVTLIAIYFFTNKLATSRSIQLLCLMFIAAVSCVVTSFIVITGGLHSAYFGVLNLAAVGTVAFLSMELAYAVAGIAIVYLPFYLLLFISLYEPNQLGLLIINAFQVISFVWVAIVIRHFNEKIREAELGNRVLLGNEVAEREKAIKKHTAVQGTLLRDAAVGAVTNQVLHDLKGPMSAISALSHSNGLPEREKAVMHAVHTRIDLLLKQLGHLSSPNASVGSLVSTLHPVYLETTYICTASKVKLEWQWPLESSRFCTDHIALSRVLSNLTQNSLEALRAIDAPKLKVSVAVTSSGAVRTLTLTVADNGAGIPDSLSADIFKKGTSSSRSTGLGLSFVRSFLETHGGQVSLLPSVEGFTTIFEVKLPETFKTHQVAG